jgi:hypothetical protein
VASGAAVSGVDMVVRKTKVVDGCATQAQAATASSSSFNPVIPDGT